MAKEFGSIVTLVRNGAELNALVASSSQQADGEHLTVVYLDPSLASVASSVIDSAIKKFFVAPLVEGKTTGWKELGVPEARPEDIALHDALVKGNDLAVEELKKQGDAFKAAVAAASKALHDVCDADAAGDEAKFKESEARLIDAVDKLEPKEAAPEAVADPTPSPEPAPTTESGPTPSESTPEPSSTSEQPAASD